MREGCVDSDCNISEEKFTKFTNVELANTLGNLYQRCLPFNLKREYPSYADVKSGITSKRELDLVSQIDSLRDLCDEHYEAFDYNKVIQAIMNPLRESNTLVQEYKPWELIKSKKEEDLVKVKRMLYLVYESLRVCGILLQPIVPNVSGKLLDKLAVEHAERSYEFAKIDYKRDKTKNISSNAEVIFKRI